MSAIQGLLQRARIESGSRRAVIGGVSGGTAALIAFGTVDGLLTQAAVTGGLTFVFIVVAGLGYSAVGGK
ncbi:hypothetical protein [Halorientalis litorea]|jgi:hypothetical protein|uniref:hypothetical protein n=1 Tax=Halorientalis litorea TaxID=2931977 RepID=UPI001FF5AF36|nr:hypothetical protein [Halorientalis litorea]